MQNKIKTSRSVVIDPIFKKSLEQSYEKHKLKLKLIQERKPQNQIFDVDDALKRKLSVKQASEKVKKQLDPHYYENKAMLTHIRYILQRKGETFSQMKKYKNSALQNEKKQIQRQNKILIEKIKEKKEQKLTKKDLRKQFAEYESQKNLLRKVWYSSANHSKPKLQKSVQKLSSDHRHHQ